MMREHVQIDLTKTPNIRRKGILSLLVIFTIIVPAISVHAEIGFENKLPLIYWKHYPYRPSGTELIFPNDEGAHATQQYPIEWWYANFHLKGQSTGQEYGSFIAFYKIQTTFAEKQEIRIFSISDIAAEKTYTNAQIGTLTASTDHLNLSFGYITKEYDSYNQSGMSMVTGISQVENQETSMVTKQSAPSMQLMIQNTMMRTQLTNMTGDYYDDDEKEDVEFLNYDCWYTKSDDFGLLPFQYHLNIGGNSQQDHQPMNLTVDMDCQKRPLLVGGDGNVLLGKNQHLSYYYCLSKLAVTGSITLHGMTEDITGFAWIDHQWGDFLNRNPPPYGMVVSYEWFSIKLNDNREILAGDTWDQDTGEKINQSFSNGLNLLNSDSTLELLEEYTIVPEAFWNDNQTHKVFASKWRILESSKLIDIIITPLYADQMMRVGQDYPAIRQILDKIIPGSCFWEGVCTVSGTINKMNIEGRAYVELTHHYDNI